MLPLKHPLLPTVAEYKQLSNGCVLITEDLVEFQKSLHQQAAVLDEYSFTADELNKMIASVFDDQSSDNQKGLLANDPAISKMQRTSYAIAANSLSQHPPHRSPENFLPLTAKETKNLYFIDQNDTARQGYFRKKTNSASNKGLTFVDETRSTISKAHQHRRENWYR